MDNNENKTMPVLVFKENLKPKKINLKIAPGNWSRLKKYVHTYNETRTGQKLNYTDVINIAIGRYFEERSQD